jgi:hypothetical protein
VSLFCDGQATSLTRRGMLASRQFLAGRGKASVADTPVLARTLPSLLHIFQNVQQFLGGREIAGDTRVLEQIFDPITQAAPERAVQAVEHAAGVVERNRTARIGRLQIRLGSDWQESPNE